VLPRSAMRLEETGRAAERMRLPDEA
jgi:hypothetical protein